MRESIFNSLFSLGAVEGATVLDLFAGSGALGLEALSRGAAHVTFVDSHRSAAAVIQKNLDTLGFTEMGTIVAADAAQWLARTSQAYDVILCDPPYGFDDWPALLGAVRGTAHGQILVAESNRAIAPAGDWSVLRSKRYGSTIVTFFAPNAPASPESSRAEEPQLET